MKSIFFNTAVFCSAFSGVYLPIALLTEFSDSGELVSTTGLWAGAFALSIICGFLYEKDIKGIVLWVLFPAGGFASLSFLFFGVFLLIATYLPAIYMLLDKVVFLSSVTQSMFGYIFIVLGVILGSLVILVGSKS